MITSLFQGAIGWLAGLTEAAVAIAVMLLIGLVVGMTGFWMLSRSLRKLAGPAAELDPSEDETEEIEGAEVVTICPDEDSPPSNLGP